MPYIKLLTVLTTLALLTACGGGGKTADNAGKSANLCIENPFGATCSADDSTIISLRQSVCLADTTINPACTGEAGIATVFCKANPFDNSNACRADTGAIALRQTQCIEDATTNPTCGGVISNFCKTNPFQESACLPNDTYLPLRIADCIKDGKADTPNCGLITTKAGKNTALTSCLTNPFAEVCETSVPDFTSSFEQARTNRASFCDNSLNVADDLCTGDNVTPICEFDQFTAICPDATYLSKRLDECIMAGNAENTKCNTVSFDATMNTAITDCLTNPFKTECESVTAFMSDFALARTNRLTFCNDNANVANGLCTGENLMNVCVFDPFNAICFTEPTYLTARFNNCITGGNAGDNKCDTIVSDSTMNTAITACLTNPFSDACASNTNFDDYADMARENRVAFCESGSGELCTALTACQGNPFGTGCGAYFEPAKIPHCAIRTNAGGDCATTLSRPNAATWAHSFATELRTEEFSTAEETSQNNKGHFLQGTADGLNNGTRTLNTLNFNDAFNDGNMTDGLGYFTGNVFRLYAGIFSGTDLGAPVTETTGTAEWSGFIQDGNAFPTATAFPLTVGFTGTGGTLDAFIPHPRINTVAFTIDGDFDAKGVITGVVFRRVYGDNTDSSTFVSSNNLNSDGTIRGLIGQEGAVAVFVSDANVAVSFAGGFVAKPPAE